jgi:tryptophanyl-tRNA synthetase
MEDKIIIDPYNVQGIKGKKLDYEKLIVSYGSKSITTDLLHRIQNVNKEIPLHPFLTREIFFSHRDLESILTLHEAGKPFYLYTGRGPSSSSLHLGHLVPFLFTKYLQTVFNVPVVIQITDDEKFLFKPITLEESQTYAVENIKDIIACGFNREKTFIFQNTTYIGELYHNVCKIQKALSFNQVRSSFGFNVEDPTLNIPAIQAAPCFSSSFSKLFNDTKMACLVPCAIDQDNYFRLTRDVSKLLKHPKPSLIHSKFLPSLLGVHEKMSSSDKKSVIYMTDTPIEITEKINRNAFSGSRGTLKEHLEHGADLDVDIAYQYLKFFYNDDEKLNTIATEYKTGKVTTIQVKKILIDTLIPLVENFKISRSIFTSVRRLV